MSSSYRKSTTHIVAINRPSHGQTPADLRARVEALAAQALAFPHIKENTLTAELTIPNDSLDEHVRAAGLPVPSLSIFGKGQFETTDVLLEVMRHQGTRQILSNPEFTPDGVNGESARTDVFLAQSQIHIDQEWTSNDRVQALMILEARDETLVGGSTEGFEPKVDSIVDRFINLGIVEKNVLKVTVFRPDLKMDVLDEHHVQAASRIGFVSHVEFEFMKDGDLHELITTITKDFNLTMTAADTVVLHQK